MSNIISAIQDLLTVVVLGSGILLFASEIKLEALKKASKGSTKLSSFTERMTGQGLDLGYKRVYDH